MKIFQANETRRGLASIIQGVEFEKRGEKSLKMDIIYPQQSQHTDERYPLIVFLQGSGWTVPGFGYEIPQMCRFAQEGYIVAMVTHRHANEARGKLGFLEDTKSAIRFLRANAEKYKIDPERICMWGTSSGGNTALLIAMTADTDEYDVGSNLEYKSDVKLVIDTFGPTDLVPMMEWWAKSGRPMDPNSVFACIAGGDPAENMENIYKMSPMQYVDRGLKLPPMLIMNGTTDALVSYESSLKFYEAMKDAGYDVEFVKVEGGPHEDTFWSPELFEYIGEYIKERL